jgi:chromosome segregation ATPase
MFGIRSKNRRIEELEIQLRVAKFDLKAKDASHEAYLKTWKETRDKLKEEASRAGDELLRRMAHNDQLVADVKKREERIRSLESTIKELTDKLEHYKPLQGVGGRFIKKRTVSVD